MEPELDRVPATRALARPEPPLLTELLLRLLAVAAREHHPGIGWEVHDRLRARGLCQRELAADAGGEDMELVVLALADGDRHPVREVLDVDQGVAPEQRHLEDLVVLGG